jgi:hypothetical protein
VWGHDQQDDARDGNDSAENANPTNAILRPLPRFEVADHAPKLVPMKPSSGPANKKVIPATKMPAERLNCTIPPD